MTTEQQPADTLGDLLASRRQRRFVGRAGEVELFRSALTADGSPFAVLHLHGPGGIGKTTLLEVLAELAAAEAATVVRLDARELVASPSAVLSAIGATVAVPDEGPIVPTTGRLVLLIDAYERLAPVDDWVRDQLVPRLPATALTVLASRVPPAPGWRSDAAWRDLLRVVSLRNLDPDDARRYLDASGVEAGLHDRLVTLSHGHPLGLSLLADVVLRGGEVGTGRLSPDLVGDLLRTFVDVVPDTEQRTALAACAISRVTTEALLRDVLEVADAHALFRWLQDLSFVETGPDGVLPHDLARDTLDADLRWRDPQEYTRIFRRVAGHIHGRLRDLDGRTQLRAISDLKYLFRNLPSVLAPLDWDAWGQHHPEPAAPPDRDTILALIAAAEGDEVAAIAARWWERQPDGFSVVRGDDDTVRGVIAILDLTAAAPEDVAADPVARAAWDHAHAQAPPRPGEVVTLTRFVIDRDAYQGPSPTLNAVPVLTLQRQLTTPTLAWDCLALHEPDHLDAFFALADLHRAPQADVEVAGRRYGLFGHDYRRVPIDDLVQLWIERALTQDPALHPAPAPTVEVLSQAEFTEAVRHGLRDLHRADVLARNPLLRTRLLHDRAAQGEEPDVATLAALLRTAVDSLRVHPRDDKLLRAVERTYLDPAPTQEAAAARLGLPFSTYRRHLTQGVERIVAWLWDQEVYGAAPRSPDAR